jgi:PEP-CTERM motif
VHKLAPVDLLPEENFIRATHKLFFFMQLEWYLPAAIGTRRADAPVTKEFMNSEGGYKVVRITSLQLLVLIVFIATSLAMVPAAAATTFDITIGTTIVGTATLTTSGTCGTATIGSGDVCLSVTMSGSNTLRVGGDVIGLIGTISSDSGDVSPGIDFDSSGLLSIASHPCNSHLGGSSAICITAGSGADITSLALLLDGTVTGIAGFHVASTACGSSPTCFATVTQVATVPEPGTLGLLGAGLIGIAGLVRRRHTR